jgi:hypothetical protein
MLIFPGKFEKMSVLKRNNLEVIEKKFLSWFSSPVKVLFIIFLFIKQQNDRFLQVYLYHLFFSIFIKNKHLTGIYNRSDKYLYLKCRAIKNCHILGRNKYVIGFYVPVVGGRGERWGAPPPPPSMQCLHQGCH